MFFEDAKLVSKELELTLTGKECGLPQRAPMCGVPYHSANTYIRRLIDKGYKVAICEQMEDPATAKGLVKRDVIRLITPGTVIEEDLLEESKNNYLAALMLGKGELAVCFADVSTGGDYGVVPKLLGPCRGSHQRIGKVHPFGAALFQKPGAESRPFQLCPGPAGLCGFFTGTGRLPAGTAGGR